MPDRVIAGDTPRLQNEFKVDGTLTDPTTITLVVTDPQGNTEGTYTHAGGTVSKASTGIYYKDLTLDEDGVWEFVWTGTGAAADIASGSITVYPASVEDIDVLTLPEAKTAVGLEQTNTDHDEYLRSLITAVSGQLDQMCGPVRNRTVTDEAHDGGGTFIRLRRRPVYSITSISEYSNTSAQSLTAETNSAKTASNFLHDGTPGTIHSGTIRRRTSNSDHPFAEGRRNVVVTYVAGRAANTEVVPAKFKQAAAMMLRNIFTAEQASGTETFGVFADPNINPLLGPGMLNKVVALLNGETLDGVFVG